MHCQLKKCIVLVTLFSPWQGVKITAGNGKSRPQAEWEWKAALPNSNHVRLCHLAIPSIILHCHTYGFKDGAILPNVAAGSDSQPTNQTSTQVTATHTCTVSMSAARLSTCTREALHVVLRVGHGSFDGRWTRSRVAMKQQHGTWNQEGTEHNARQEPTSVSHFGRWMMSQFLICPVLGIKW